MKLTKRKGFNFFRSYYDVYNELTTDKEKAQFIDALLDRQFLGIEPTDLKGMPRFAYISQTNSIDSQVKGYEDKLNVRLDGRPYIKDESTPMQGGKTTPTDGGKLTPCQQGKEEVQEEVQEEGKVQETKPPKPKKVFSQDVFDCYYSILPHFDESTKPKENQVDSWLDTIEKLNRIDGYDFNDIIHLVSKTREDTFWKSNFLSINKLRQKNKDGITYWNVFYNKFKQTNNNNSSYDINELIRRKLEDPTL